MRGSAAWLETIVLVANCLGVASAQVTLRVSTDSAGAQGNGGSFEPSASGDGRFVAFPSLASNLVLGDSNGFTDVFVHDRQTGSVTRVSVDSSGAQGNGASIAPSISADGRYVAFQSWANNLVSGDTFGRPDIFVHDRLTGSTTRVNVSSAGAQASGDSTNPSLSADGRYVVFESLASNLVSGDTNASIDVFLHDRQVATTERVSVTSAGAQGLVDSRIPTVSADGRNVAFESQHAFVAGDTNSAIDVFVRDRQTSTTSRVSVHSSGTQGNSTSNNAQISADGRYVAFQSGANNLIGGDTNNTVDVFVHDRQTGVTTCASVNSGGALGNGYSFLPALSSDGRYVAFHSFAVNFVAADGNGNDDVFVHDRQMATTTRASSTPAGAAGDGESRFASISGDGQHVAFWSYATDLVAGDTNATADVFVHGSGTGGGASTYCTAGTTTNGCLPSMSGWGTPSASAGSGFSIGMAHVEGQKIGLLFYGLSGPHSATWGTSSSFLCVKSPTQRIPSQDSGGSAGACNGSVSVDWNNYVATHPSALGAPFTGGETVHVQGWFRDPPTPKTTMLSNGLQFVVGP